jgi:TPP-dependent pyruvate/acetoin dehydrogenase alpha subunit
VTASGVALSLDRRLAREMLERMLRIRAFETHANELYRSAKMPGLTHLYIGQEAVAVGVCSALRRDDTITSTHRGHGHCIAKGADVGRMYCELLGRAEGYCRGKGGSMHIADHANGNLGANAIVGGSAGIATGAGFAAKRLGTDRVSVCFFGEGALGQGLLYEVMNMASLWSLPVIYVCENNLYNEYTSYEEVTAGSVPARAEAFGIPTVDVDGQDVVAVYEATTRAVERARSGGGPTFLHCATYRYHGHHVGDVDRAYYRSRDEEALWVRDRDPIAMLASRLGDDDENERLRQRVEAEVDAAVEYALSAPYPEPDEVTEDVFA